MLMLPMLLAASYVLAWRACVVVGFTGTQRGSNDWYKVDRQLLKRRNYRRGPVGLISQVKLSLGVIALHIYDLL